MTHYRRYPPCDYCGTTSEPRTARRTEYHARIDRGQHAVEHICPSCENRERVQIRGTLRSSIGSLLFAQG